jgi:hypothetical protein
MCWSLSPSFVTKETLAIKKKEEKNKIWTYEGPSIEKKESWMRGGPNI